MRHFIPKIPPLHHRWQRLDAAGRTVDTSLCAGVYDFIVDYPLLATPREATEFPEVSCRLCLNLLRARGEPTDAVKQPEFAV